MDELGTCSFQVGTAGGSSGPMKQTGAASPR